MRDVGPADATLLYCENKQVKDFLEILLYIWKFLNLEIFAISVPPFREIPGSADAVELRRKGIKTV